jgi:hypothetical protein
MRTCTWFGWRTSDTPLMRCAPPHVHIPIPSHPLPSHPIASHPIASHSLSSTRARIDRHFAAARGHRRHQRRTPAARHVACSTAHSDCMRALSLLTVVWARACCGPWHVPSHYMRALSLLTVTCALCACCSLCPLPSACVLQVRPDRLRRHAQHARRLSPVGGGARVDRVVPSVA